MKPLFPWRVWLRRFIVALALPLLLGCDKPAEPFRIGTNIWIGYEPLYLAQAKGFFASDAIRMVAMHNATEVQQALRAGVLEAATLTLDEALTVKHDGIDLKVILVMDTSHGADVLVAHPEIRHLAELKGKRIGVESTAVGAIMLQGALEAAGLAIADINLVQLSIDQHVTAYQKKQVDAVVTFDPVRTQLLSAGAHVIFDSTRIPGRIVDVLVTTPEIARRRPHELRQILAGHFRALDYLRAAPLEATAMMTTRQGITAEEIIASYKGLHIPDLAENRRLLSAQTPALTVSAKHLAELMLTPKLLQHQVSVDNLLDDRFLPGS